MDQLEFFEIPSPCIGVCQSGKNGYCVGCYRSREERTYWHQASPYAKRVIVKACARRKSHHNKSNKVNVSDNSQGRQTSLFDDNL